MQIKNVHMAIGVAAMFLVFCQFLFGCGASSGSSSGSSGISAFFVKISTDNGASFSGIQTGTILGSTVEGAVDPAAVLLSDGRIRMYYFGSYSTSGDPVTSQPDGINRFYSAVSSDGLVFTQEAQVITGEAISDPFVLQIADGSYVMYISSGSRVLSARSSDGQNFTWDDGYRLNAGGVPGALLLSNNLVRLYYMANSGIKSAISTDEAGMYFSTEEGFRIEAPSGGELAGDPNPIEVSTGQYLMCYKVGLGSDLSSHRVFLASSSDGVTWTTTSTTEIMDGSVPTIIEDTSNRLLLYVPGQ